MSSRRAPESVVTLLRGLQPSLTVALESNGKGVLGHIVDLPGGFVRGKTEAEALAKVNIEANHYLHWAGMEGGRFQGFAAQRSRSNRAVEDADTDVLLDADRRKMRPEEFRAFHDLTLYSGGTFAKAYEGAKLKTWADETKRRQTFYGPCPASIEETFQHVRSAQADYLSKLGFPLQHGDFMMMRRLGLNSLRQEFEAHNNKAPVVVNGELWTLKKVMRRMVLHDRIHGKAISRMMRKQEQLGLIGEFPDPFHFASLS